MLQIESTISFLLLDVYKMTWDVSGLFSPLVSLNWRRVDPDRQQTLTFVCTWRITWSETLTHSTVMSWQRRRDRTAVNHKPGQVSPSESRTNLRAPYGTTPKTILSQTFHQAGPAPDLRGKTSNWGNSTKSTNHQRGITEHPIRTWIWLRAPRHKQSRKLRRTGPARVSAMELK